MCLRLRRTFNVKKGKAINSEPRINPDGGGARFSDDAVSGLLGCQNTHCTQGPPRTTTVSLLESSALPRVWLPEPVQKSGRGRRSKTSCRTTGRSSRRRPRLSIRRYFGHSRAPHLLSQAALNLDLSTGLAAGVVVVSTVQRPYARHARGTRRWGSCPALLTRCDPPPICTW